MLSGPIPNLVLRGFQMVFAAIVLGLTVSMAKDQIVGGIPATQGYVAFVGAISLVAGAVGIAASWFDFLAGKIGMALDAFICVLNLAGGIIVAIKLKGVTCDGPNFDDNDDKMNENNWLNGGCTKNGCAYNVRSSVTESHDGILDRCKKTQADTAFMFLTVVVLLVSATLGFLRMKKGY